MSGFQGANTAEGGEGFTIAGVSANSSHLMEMLTAEDIVPGARPSYQLCKTIYAYHPLGAKMAEAPIQLAQSQERELTVPSGPENLLIQAFKREWDQIGGKDVNGNDVSASVIIRNLMKTSRMYGIASLIVGERDKDNTTDPLKLDELADADLYFNVLDPLNTAGSLVLDQDPSSPDFQKARSVTIGSRAYHPSRAVIMMNESPLYIEFTDSAFGFVGRSCYQRALYPLKTFLQTMITDQYVALKVGLLIAKMDSPGSVVSNRILNFFGFKRQQLKSGNTGNVLTIGLKEEIESLNFQNLEGPATMARNNALKNIAMSANMPAKLLEQETMVGGMAEGSEDAKQISRYIDLVREDMIAPYRFMDRLVQRRAWSPAFYKTVQAEIAEYKNIPYETAFYSWVNSFNAKWPNLLEEPDSEKIKVEDTRFKAAVALFEVMVPVFDPVNIAKAATWLVNEINSRRELFSAELEIDEAALKKHGEDQVEQQKQAAMQPPGSPGGGGKEPGEPKPFGGTT